MKLAVVCDAQSGGGQHSEAASQHGGEVGEDVAEDVAGNDDVELPGVSNQLHGAVVGVHVMQFDIGELESVQLRDRLPPYQAALGDVGLLDAANDIVSATCQIEGYARYAFYLGGRVCLRVESSHLSVG